MALSAAYATLYAVKSQGYRVKGWINDATTGNGMDLSAGGTTLSATITKDDGTAVSTTNTPQKVTGQAGRFYLDLTAAEMAYSNVGVVVSCNLANQMEAKIDILIMDLTELTGPWWEESILKKEQMDMQLAGYILQANQRNNGTGTITLYQRNGTTVIGTMSGANNGTVESKGALS